jgi:CHAT domain-containing protein/Tfp pilus assembly protein PilF
LDPSNNNSLLQLAKKERINGNFRNAIALFDECLSESTNDRYIELESLYNLAILYWNIGDLKSSKTFFLRSADLAKRNQARQIENDSLSAIEVHDLYQSGKALRVAEKYEESITAYNQAIRISKDIQIPELELKCSRLLSLTYWEIDDVNDFYELNLRALQLAEQLNHSRERGRCLNNIGAYFSRLDNYDAALDSYEKALGIATDNKYSEDIAAALLNLGGVWSDLGNYDNALKYLGQALKLDNQLKDNSSIAKDLNNIGIATRLRGLATENREDIKNAENCFKEALRISKELNDESFEIQALNNLGSIYADLHEYESALGFFTRAAHLAEQNNDSSYLGMIYNNIGAIYSYKNSIELSNRYYDLALDLSSKYKDGTFIWETYLELANLNKKQNRYAKAYQYYKDSIKSIEEIRSKIKIEDLKATYLGTDKRLEAYQNLIDLLVKLHGMAPNKGYDKEAFDYLERAKARAFLDSLEVARLDIAEGINPVLLNREKQIMREIAKSYSKLLGPNLSAAERDGISSQLRASEDRLEILKREIRASSPAYADLKYPMVMTYDEARESLSASDTGYLAYSIGNDASYGFFISARGFNIFSIPPRKVVQQKVAAYRKAIADRQNKDFHLGRELFQELVQPGLEPGIKKIIIVPDDILNLLPFEVLLTSDKPDSWLVRNYTIGYVPSLSSLRVLQVRHRNGSKPRKDLLAIGNPTYGCGIQEEGKLTNAAMLYDLNSASGIALPPLKYSAVEVENISSLFRPNKVTVLQKEDASGRWLRSHPLSDYKIIHFATHSIIDDKKPARSAILLSYPKNQAGNGLFQTRDIYNLKLNSDLVTLSACQSGLGQFIRGEGIEGLSRAFFYAGSSSVLMSLWSVNDQATYLLMERFYRHLKGSESIMGALRNAKLEMIGSSTLSHPYYWAGFIIAGKADARVFSDFPYLTVLLVALLAGGLFLMTVIMVRKRQEPSARPNP